MAEKEKPEKVESRDKIGEFRLERPIRGYLVGTTVIITEDYDLALALYNRSAFGEPHGPKEKRIELSLVEALYLMERKKLEIFDGKQKLNFEMFVRKAKRRERGFWTRYRVYRDIRTRGYIVKTALKFGADFRVYPRGKRPGQAHAKWVLFCTAESDTYNWREFAAMNRVAHSTRKRLLIGIVDEEGDVTYYEVRWKKP